MDYKPSVPPRDVSMLTSEVPSHWVTDPKMMVIFSGGRALEPILGPKDWPTTSNLTLNDITKPRKKDEAKPKSGNRDNSPHDLGATWNGDPRGERHSPGTAWRPGNPGNFGRDFPAKDMWPRTADFPALKDPDYNRDMKGPRYANNNARSTYACFNCVEANHNRDTCRWDRPGCLFYC